MYSNAVPTPTSVSPIPGMPGMVDQLRIMQDRLDQMDVRLVEATSLAGKYSDLLAAYNAQTATLAAMQQDLLRLREGFNSQQDSYSSNCAFNEIANVPQIRPHSPEQSNAADGVVIPPEAQETQGKAPTILFIYLDIWF
jgi:hypothetical protein